MQELPTFSHFLWYPWRKCKVGKNAILGLSRAEMVRDTCFQSNIVSVTCVLTRIVDKYVPINTITGLALETLIASVELLSASCEKGANLHVAIGA